MKEAVHVFRKIIRNGVEIKIKRKTFQITYHQNIWDKFPVPLRKLFADSMAYVTTWQLPFLENTKTVYHFPHPLTEPVFFKLLLYCLPMTVFEHSEITTSEIIKKFYNASFETQYKAINQEYSGKKTKKNLKNRGFILFSFGKESLLSFSLLKEIGVKPIMVFMQEPQSIFENHHKRRLAEKFYEVTNEEIEFFPISIGKIRQEDGYCWGWDIILSQYAFFLIPYFFAYHAKYLFFGNEQGCSFFTPDKENFLVNPSFEQGLPGMQLLQDLPRMFFIQTQIGSLVEPIHQLLITFILHHRYPQIGHFQMSCFSEEPQAKKRIWCGHCEKCGRMYIIFKALNIKPESVNLNDRTMLSSAKEDLYMIFNRDSDSALGGSGLGDDEQLLAFYLAYKRGVKGELIDKFVKTYLPEVEKKKRKLVDEYFGIHTSFSLPSAIRKKVLRIFEKEREIALEQIEKLLYTTLL